MEFWEGERASLVTEECEATTNPLLTHSCSRASLKMCLASLRSAQKEKEKEKEKTETELEIEEINDSGDEATTIDDLGWAGMKSKAQLQVEKNVPIEVNPDSIYKPIERKVSERSERASRKKSIRAKTKLTLFH